MIGYSDAALFAWVWTSVPEPGFQARSQDAHILRAVGRAWAWRRLGAQNVTVQGYRSAFRDWAGNESSFSREIAEAALSHVIGDKAELAYRLGDALEKRRVLMEAWADHCGSKEVNVI